VDKARLIELEDGFWLSAGDAEQYARNLDAEALHVFPGWGITDRTAALEGVASAEPWRSHTIDDAHVIELGDEAAALVYTTEARRASGSTYRAAITSVYRRFGEDWRLVLHQQTPLESFRSERR
jgi:hypothetical protein